MSDTGCGIIGLPNVGKSSLFNALTQAGIPASNYPFCTIEPNVGSVIVSDDRLAPLAEIHGSGKIIPTYMNFVDIAGLVKGASSGEGLGNKFLANIRETDAVAHVVRCFENLDIVHVSGKIDPIDDVIIINLELIMADLQTCQNIISKMEKLLKSNKEIAVSLNLMKRIEEHLYKGQPLRVMEFSDADILILKQYQFITYKPVLYVANVDEASLPEMRNEYVNALVDFANKEGSLVVPICASLEAELIDLPIEDQMSILSDLGLQETGLNRLIRSAFETLGLICFFTCGPMETRAWTIKKGTTAVEAAGKIHTDIQKNFIRAEIVSYENMIKFGSKIKVREAGLLKTESKDYVMNDGDIVLFLHS